MLFLHAADLHLRARDGEAEHGLSVLAELMRIAASDSGGVLVLAGDAFDSNADFMALYPELKSMAEKERGLAALLMIAGNHDRLRGDRGPSSFDSGGKVRLAWDGTESARIGADGGEAEFVLVPYGCPMPEKAPPPAIPRIVVAHGSLPELNWIGIGEEGEVDESVLDGSRITALSPSYVALGHIHEGRSASLGSAIAAYPGSASPWRKGETGPRRAIRVEISSDGKASARSVELKAAGRYVPLSLRVPLDAEGFPGKEAADAFSKLSDRDWADVELSGIVRTETDAVRAQEELERAYAGKVRKLTVGREDLVILERAEDAAAARDFYRAWEADRARLEGLHGEAATLKALEIGLSRIAKSRGGRP